MLPTLVPWYFWDESIIISFFIPAILRYTIGLNATWLVNSAAHMFGNRPYDQYINPRENPLVSLGALGMFSIHVFCCGYTVECGLHIGTVAASGKFCECRCPYFPLHHSPSAFASGVFPRLASEYIRAVGLSAPTSLFLGWK